MKKLIVSIFLLTAIGVSAKKVSVLPASSAKELNGITYSLPKTKLRIEFSIVKITQKAGPYNKYSRQYLGISDVIATDKVSHELGAITIKNIAIPDTAKIYKIIGDSRSLPSVSFTRTGIISGINVIPEKTAIPPLKNEPTEETISSISFNFSGLTEEAMTSNSPAKMAESAAHQIYRIREGRLELINGDIVGMPADGKSMKLMLQNMDRIEQDLTELFVGKTIRSTIKKTIEYIPSDNVENFILARFSTANGLLPADDTNGLPVYLTISAEKNTAAIPECSKKNSCYGYFFNVPGKATVNISDGKNVLSERSCLMPQFGGVQVLPSDLNVKIKFDERTGMVLSVEK